MFKKFRKYFILLLLAIFLMPKPAYAMHISEGVLPFKWALFWYLVAFPFVAAGLLSIKKMVEKNPRSKILLVLSGAFVFVLSSLKMPSIGGSCSHPTGIGLGSIMFGPVVMSVIGTIVLIFQALLLAHGGISTLGANVFSMAIVGPITGYFVFKFSQKLKIRRSISVFLAAFCSDLFTYITTSLQLSLVFTSVSGGVWASFMKFAGLFAVTQLPIAVSEGLLTVFVFNMLVSNCNKELQELNVFKEDLNNEEQA